jgi:diguanylate cyclase (GGDEF)-like protein
MEKRILVVDDDRLIRELVRDVLTPEGFRVVTVASATEALERMRGEGPPEVVITDLSMREMDGLQLLEVIKTDFPKTDVIILTGYASLESALQAMRLGAADYLRKPVREPEIVYGVKRTILRRRLLAENTSLRSSLQAFEATRVLTSCLEPSDILPLALDIILRITSRRRAVGRLVHAEPGTSSCGTCLVGFDDVEAGALREQIDRGKAYDPGSLDLLPGTAAGALRDAISCLDRPDEPLALPLRVDGRLVGGIWVHAEGRAFEEDEVRGAELVVAQSELALINAERFLQAREKAFIDDVTELYNARYLLAALDRETNRAERSKLQLSVLFLDLDRFKTVNDRHGHLVGSRVLKEFGQLLHRSIRTIDTVGRYGGDEFTILLVDTDHAGALRVAERIRQLVEDTRFGADRGLKLKLTVSVGVSTFPQHGSDRETLLDRSDKAMYLGKAQGRNQVCSVDDLTQASAPTL